MKSIKKCPKLTIQHLEPRGMKVTVDGPLRKEIIFSNGDESQVIQYLCNILGWDLVEKTVE